MLGDNPRLTVFTTNAVVEQHRPIVTVYHDREDDWQFFAEGDTNESANAQLVSAEEILKIDPSLRNIADLPPGQMATRDSPDDAWTVGPMPEADANGINNH